MKKKMISLLFIILMLTLTLGCGTEKTNIETNSQNNTKEDTQEEIIPEKVNQDDEAKLIITKAIQDLEVARRTYKLIKNDQNSLLLKTSVIADKIDISNVRGDFTDTDLINITKYIETMQNNISGLNKSIGLYDSSINYFNETEKLNISSDYRAYISKYKEAAIKERNGVIQYERAMSNKIKLLSAKTYIGFYIIYMNISDYYYKVSATYYHNNQEILDKVFYYKKMAYESIDNAYALVSISKLSRSSSGTEVYESLLTWEDTHVTMNLNLSEKNINEAEKLFEEANKILQQ